MGHERTVKEVEDEMDEMCRQMTRLMDDYSSTIGRLEHCLRNGGVHLAKNRFYMGNRKVSGLELPWFGAYTSRFKVIREEEGATIRLAFDEQGYDPIKRNKFLSSCRCLRTAQEEFYKCIESTVEATRIKLEMEKIQGNYSKLKDLRRQLIKSQIGDDQK